MQAFRGHVEEHNLITDIMQRYAVFKEGVGFTLKRQESSGARGAPQGEAGAEGGGMACCAVYADQGAVCGRATSVRPI